MPAHPEKLRARCPEADRALHTAAGNTKLSPIDFAELFFETVGKPLEACRCRVDFAALQASLWSRLRPPSGKAIYVVTTPLSEPQDETTPSLEADAAEPWHNAHALILEAARAGDPIRLRANASMPPP